MFKAVSKQLKNNTKITIYKDGEKFHELKTTRKVTHVTVHQLFAGYHGQFEYVSAHKSFELANKLDECDKSIVVIEVDGAEQPTKPTAE